MSEFPLGVDLRRVGIYQITNIANGKRYIGSSQNIWRRWKRHTFMLRNGKHFNSHLQNAWNKYGEIYFILKPVILCETYELQRYEQACIDIFKPEYNGATDVKAPMRGRKFSEETKEKLRLSHLGYIPTEEARKNMGLASASRIRQPRSEETKEKLRQALLGRTHPGHPMSEETKEKLLLTHLGHHHSEETKAKMSASHKANPNNSGRFKKGVK